MRIPSSTSHRRSGFTVLAAGLVLLVVGFATRPAVAAPTPTAYTGNPSLASLGFEHSFKIDRQPVAGTYTATSPGVETHGTMPVGLEITISAVVVDTVAKTVTFSWAASVPDGDDPGSDRDPFLVSVVLVKFGDGGLRYDYAAPGVSADSGLYSTRDSISHVDFGWNPTEPTTSSSEPTTSSSEPTTSVEPTTSSIEGTTITTGDSQTSPTVGGVQLPRTGLATLPLLEVGAAMVLVGMALVVATRRQLPLG